MLIASPKVATYDLKPEMSAYEVMEEAVRRILSGAYDVIILNFANCDMVGHTGIYEAACKAVSPSLPTPLTPCPSISWVPTCGCGMDGWPISPPLCWTSWAWKSQQRWMGRP